MVQLQDMNIRFIGHASEHKTINTILAMYADTIALSMNMIIFKGTHNHVMVVSN